MKELNNGCFDAPSFSHIYIEQDIMEHPITQKLLEQFPKARRVVIEHYKDVFCRRGQRYDLQHHSQNLILAKRTDHYLYQGARVCQDFGNEYFYYCSSVMNCIYDCEYCYLKGMYPSGNMVVFVNLEDTFAALERVLEEHPVYLCISYDSDLMALEHMLGYCARWASFAENHRNLTIEIRTKSARENMWEALPVLANVVYAFTISPERIVKESEHYTPTMKARIQAAVRGMVLGHPVRLCFDPMLYCPDWQMEYGQMLLEIESEMDKQGVTWKACKDISVGTFRISQDYLKNLRRISPNSQVVQFPYQNRDGVYQYPPKLLEQMENWMLQELGQKMEAERIFRDEW